MKRRLITACTLVLLMLVAHFQKSTAQSNFPESPLKGQTWIRLGGPQGGIGYDIRIDSNNPEIYYVTDAFSGFHKSIDGGQNWFQINNGITTRGGDTGDAIPAFSISIDPNNSSILWGGLQGITGIFKSENGGESWVKMVNGIEEEGITFRGFTVDPTDSNIVYAAGEISSWDWSGEVQTGIAFDKAKGVVYRTTKGGEMWSKIWDGDSLARYVWIDPRNNRTIYISTGIFDRESANTDVDQLFPGGLGIIKSTDNGETWKLLNNDGELGNYYAGSLYMQSQNPDVLLAAVGNDYWSVVYPGSTINGILLSQDGGEHWEIVHREIGGVMMSVEYCESDPEIAYAAGDHHFYRSVDGGRTWKNPIPGLGYWGTPGIVGSQPIDMQCDPGNPNKLFINNYVGGNFFTDDGGETWITATQGYTGSQITGQISINPDNPAQVIAGARSGLFRSENGGVTWQGLAFEPVRLNEIYAHAVDPSNFNYILNAPADLDVSIAYSDNGGFTWYKDVTGLPEKIIGNRYITDIDFNSGDPSSVYLILGNIGCFNNGNLCKSYGGGLFFSHDRGKTWSEVNINLVENPSLLQMEIDPNNQQKIFVSSVEQGLLISDDGGLNWQSPEKEFAPAKIISIEVDPNNSLRVLVGSTGNGLFLSEDGGLSWSPIYSGLEPQGFYNSIVYDNNNPGVIYLSDLKSGVYLSQDYGQTWKPLNNGLTYRSVTTLSLSSDGNTLYAGTYGGGVFRLSTYPQSYFNSLALTSSTLPATTATSIFPSSTPSHEPVKTNTPDQSTIEAVNEIIDNGDRSNLWLIITVPIIVFGFLFILIILVRNKKGN